MAGMQMVAKAPVMFGVHGVDSGLVSGSPDSASHAARNGAGCSQVPLALATAGETVTVVKVRGTADMRRHLDNLGFVEGSCVKVVSGNGGNLIVEVKGAQIALDRQVSMKIMTTA